MYFKQPSYLVSALLPCILHHATRCKTLSCKILFHIWRSLLESDMGFESPAANEKNILKICSSRGVEPRNFPRRNLPLPTIFAETFTIGNCLRRILHEHCTQKLIFEVVSVGECKAGFDSLTTTNLI